MAQLENHRYNERPDGSKYAFATFPDGKVYKKTTGSGWKEHLIFGDYIAILNTTVRNGRVKVRARGEIGWMNVESLQQERVLEVNFVDIGQGDGCHVVTPDDQHILIDAGKGDNMYRYISWRYNLYHKTEPLPFPLLVVISHSDTDHYQGFGKIFSEKLLPISRIYHNGIVERPGEDSPFGVEKDGYVTTLVNNTTQMKRIIEDPNKRKGSYSTYPKTLYKAWKRNPNLKFDSLSVEDGYMEGFEETNELNGKEFSIELLGPIPEIKEGKKVLRYFTDAGKTKNGHSVMMKLTYGKARILLGGDLNTEAGKFLVEYYRDKGELKKLKVDVAKACHHGSNHFHYDFLESVNSVATVISSGDEESYSHPRPDTLGAIGKTSYGAKPLIFTTELARSNKEITRGRLEDIHKYWLKRDQINKDLKKNRLKLKNAADPEKPAIRAAIKADKDRLKKVDMDINSNLTKYGMINVRTDGNVMIIAQKLEVKARYGKWDIHKLHYDSSKRRFIRDGH